MQVWNVLHAVRWKYWTPSAHHRTTLSGCIFATKACINNREKLVKSNISSTYPHNMVNFGPLAAEIVSFWGTPAHFNGFRVMASLVDRRRSPQANQTLHDVWPRADTLYIHFRCSCPVTELCEVQNSLCLQVLSSPILAALLHGTRVVCISQTFRRWAEGATYIRQGGHHVGHWPTF